MSKARGLADLGNAFDDGALSNRRMTYNGAMNVWQRGTSADTASNGDYMCDRWLVGHSGLDGNVDWDQETSSTPDGFANALKISTDASETSLDAGDYLFFSQRFEGQDLQHLQKGTANAKKLALSFWVRSSVASTYTVELRDNDGTRTIGKSYEINTADTWEYKTLIFEGDTSGTFSNDANFSLELFFWIDGGSRWSGGTFSTAWQADDEDERLYDTTGWLESTSPTFYITGVQLEVGDTATPFEHRSYGDELAKCQRYYYETGPRALSLANATTTGFTFREPRYNQIALPVTMRTTPTAVRTVSEQSLSGGTELTWGKTFVGVKPTNYSGDIPSGSYSYGGAILDAEL